MKNRSRIALLIVALFILGTGTIAAYQSLSKTIAIIDDGKVTQYETFDVYVGELLDNQGIVLEDKDSVSPSEETEVTNGMKINIYRWKPTVSITVNADTTSTFTTTAKTVQDALKEKQIELTTEDEVIPALDTPITEDTKIEIKTKEVSIEKQEEEIPFETETEKTTELKEGVEEVVTEGKKGIKEKTVEIVRFGGEVVSETVKEEVVKSEPVKRVVKKGIASPVVNNKVGQNYEYTKAMTLEATGYTDIAGDRWNNKTASGSHTFVGMVAVDPRVIPLGTKLYVEGYGLAIAGDTGGAIKGDKIDLFFETRDQAYEFGRRDRKVYILKDQSIDVASERN